MPSRRRYHRFASVLFMLGAVSCGNSVAPTGTKAVAQIPLEDLMGTYMLTRFDGRSLPAAIRSATSSPADTVFAGCLVLGPLLNPNPPTDSAGIVNLTWLANAEAAAQYLRTPTQCPPFFPAAFQAYYWHGSHGTLSFCGTHACDNTDFTAAVENGAMTISTGEVGHENVYVKQ
jgi:hypothetical protein